MNVERAAGAFLIFLPLVFNLFFFLLARRFDYPGILRSSTEDILPALRPTASEPGSAQLRASAAARD